MTLPAGSGAKRAEENPQVNLNLQTNPGAHTLRPGGKPETPGGPLGTDRARRMDLRNQLALRTSLDPCRMMSPASRWLIQRYSHASVERQANAPGMRQLGSIDRA